MAFFASVFPLDLGVRGKKTSDVEVTLMFDDASSLEKLRRQVADLRQELAACRSDKHRLESALRESEFREKDARLVEVQEVAGLGFYVLDIAAGRWTSSPVLDQIFGIPVDYESTVESWGDLVHPDERPQMLAYFRKEVLGQKKPFDREYRIVRYGDKQVRWVHGLGRLRLDAKGQPVSMLGTIQDITERKLAEEQLRESEARFRSLFHDSVVGMVVAAPSGAFLQVSPAFCEFLGYSEQELLGKTIQSITYPEDWEASSKAIQRALTSGPRLLRLEKRYLHKSGRVIWGEAGATVICDAEGKPSYFITQVLDINERKLAEGELAKQRAILQATIDCLPFNFFAMGCDGRYTMQNAISKTQHGMNVIGKLPEEVCPNAHDLAIWTENNRRAFAGEKVEGEVCLSLGGEERFYCNVIAPVMDGTEFYGILGVNVDITETRRAQEALKKAHDELERRVQQRTAELQDANRQLRQEIDERQRAEEQLRQNHDELEAIYGSMVDGLLVVDIETLQLVRANASTCRMLGYSEAELLSLSPADIHPAEALPFLLEQVRSLEEAGQTRIGNIPYLRKDGSVFYAEVIGTFLNYKGRPCAMGVFRDITERQQAQEALRQSHDELRVIYDGMVDGFHILNLHTEKPVRANPALCRMMGYSEEELLSLAPADVHPPGELPRLRAELQACVEGRIQGSLNVPLVRKDGSVFYTDVTASKIYYNEAPCLLCFFRDITERKQAEEALRQSQEELRAIYDEIFDGIIVVDVETGNPVRTNTRFLSHARLHEGGSLQLVARTGESARDVAQSSGAFAIAAAGSCRQDRQLAVLA